MSARHRGPEAALGWLSVFAGSLGAILPGASYFVDASPPYFRTVGVLTSGLAVAIFLWGYATTRPSKTLPGRSLVVIAIGVTLLVGYGIALDSWTVSAPAGRDAELPRDQVGFGLAPWSLDERGASSLATAHEHGLNTPTPSLLLDLNAAHGDPEKIRTLWKPWSIVAAGSLLLAFFVAGFALYTYGFSLLARYVTSQGWKAPAPDAGIVRGDAGDPPPTGPSPAAS